LVSLLASSDLGMQLGTLTLINNMFAHVSAPADHIQFSSALDSLNIHSFLQVKERS